MKAPLLHAKQSLLPCLVLSIGLTLIQSDRAPADTSLLAPEIQQLTFEAEFLIAEVSVPPGYRHAVLELYHPGELAYWESLIAGPLTGASATVTFTIPQPGNRAMIRVRTGSDLTLPPSTLTGSQYFKPVYGSGGTYIAPSSEPLQVLNRLGYGPSIDSYSQIQAIGAAAYIDQQLAPETIDESANMALHTRVDDLFLDYLPGAPSETLLAEGAAIKFFKGLSEPPAGWMATAFDDSGWLDGISGVGYDTNLDHTYGTNLVDMQGSYSTVYIRHDFQLADKDSVEILLLNLIFDDAFIAYLNGTEVARFNIDGALPPFDSESESSGGFEENGDPAVFDLSPYKNLLLNGENTLAFQLINTSLSLSSDAALVAELVTTESAAYTAIASIKNLQHLIHLRGVYSEKQLQASLAAFWENHFCTDYDKVQDYIEELDAFEALPDGGRTQSRIEAATIEYEEYEFFYQNALGNFGDLLLYSATSPSMLIYLDGILNRKDAPNENYAREILELSAFGVDNGYEQVDIEELARCFTGWSVRKVHPSFRKPFPASARTPFTTGSIAVASELAVVDVGEVWAYFKGTEEPPASWVGDLAGNTFDDSSWLIGPTGIGMGDDDDATELDDMRQQLTAIPPVPGYYSFYARKKFTVDPTLFDDVVISIDYDDAYVAYLNGTEVGRSRSMGGTAGIPPTFDTPAQYGHSAISDGGSADTIDLAGFPNLLLPAPQQNVLAIQLHNSSLTSSDTTLRPQVLGRTLTADSIYEADPNGVWTFWFDPGEHDLTAKTLFAGSAYQIQIPAIASGSEAAGVDDALTVIDAMVSNPSTAEFICIKLVNKFVSDEISLDTYESRLAPGWLLAVVDDAIDAWNSTTPSGNIKTVMTSILDPQDKVGGFWLEGAHLSKIKDPVEFINSSFRAIGADIASTSLPDRSEDMGMLLFERDDPDGFPELGVDWSDTLGLLERMKFAQGLADNRSHSRGAWDIGTYLSESNLFSPEDLIDHIDALVFGGSLGTVRRSVLLEFANTDDTGDSSPFTGLNSNQRNNRLRELTALILSAPEFQFQ